MRKGSHHSDETKRKISEAMVGKEPWIKGKHHSDETKRKISKVNKGQTPWITGKHHSVETKQKISKANKGKTPWITGKHHSAETKQKISRANTGRKPAPWDAERRQKLRECNLGKSLSAEHKRKIAESHKGLSHTEETKLKISKIKRAQWANGVFDNVNLHPPGVTYNGIKMRSTWESRLAAAFDKLEWAWQYEPCKLQYALNDGIHTYTPDFYVPSLGCYFDPHWSLKDDTAKFAAIREQHSIGLIVLNKSLLEAYERMAGIL